MSNQETFVELKREIKNWYRADKWLAIKSTLPAIISYVPTMLLTYWRIQNANNNYIYALSMILTVVMIFFIAVVFTHSCFYIWDCLDTKTVPTHFWNTKYFKKIFCVNFWTTITCIGLLLISFVVNLIVVISVSSVNVDLGVFIFVILFLLEALFLVVSYMPAVFVLKNDIDNERKLISSISYVSKGHSLMIGNRWRFIMLLLSLVGWLLLPPFVKLIIYIPGNIWINLVYLIVLSMVQPYVIGVIANFFRNLVQEV